MTLVASAQTATADSESAVYRVRAGDYLSLIAQRFGVSLADLKRSGGGDDNLIRIGEAVQIRHPFRREMTSPPDWQAPVKHPGRTLRPYGTFQAGRIRMPRTGTDLAVPIATALYSPAVGVVRHFGALDGIGYIMIIEHPDDYATVLAPCDPDTRLVHVGEAVLAGDKVALTGPPPGPGAEPYVHIELRRHNEAIAPDRLLSRAASPPSTNQGS